MNLDLLKNKLNALKQTSKNTIFGIIAIIAIVVVVVLVSANQGGGFSLQGILGMSYQQVGEKVVNYINENQLSQAPAELAGVAGESGMVKVTIKIGEEQFESYATRDGKILWPQRGIDMEPQVADSSENSDESTQSSAPVTKSDSSVLEVFVVSRCPYGLQIQRAVAEAVKNIPELDQYINVEYIGAVSGNKITAMHGDEEAVENLRQICMRDEQSAKYHGYVACQMKTGDTAGCQTSVGIDSAKLNACISSSNKGIAYAQKDFDQSNKYGVSGSPTLILNGTKISESSFGGRSADGVKSMVCAGFNNQPDFCTTKLDTAAAAVGFSETYSTSGSSNNNVTCE